MSDDFYTMVDSGDPAPDNEHITGVREKRGQEEQAAAKAQGAMYAARIAVYDDMLSTPRVIVIEPKDVRTYLEEMMGSAKWAWIKFSTISRITMSEMCPPCSFMHW